MSRMDWMKLGAIRAAYHGPQSVLSYPMTAAARAPLPLVLTEYISSSAVRMRSSTETGGSRKLARPILKSTFQPPAFIAIRRSF